MTTARIEPADRTAEINGLRLHYLDWGEASNPPLVLLHGFSAMAHYFDGFAAYARRHFHAYALDQRGHGESDWAASYEPDDMPNDLAAFVDQLGLDRFVLLGHSMGGGVAFRYAADHPERVERLIIVDVALPHPDRPRLPNADNSVTRALAQDIYVSEDDAVAHFRRLNPQANPDRVRAAIRYWFRELPDGRVTYRFDPTLRNRFAATPDQVEQFKRDARELRAKVKRITCPTLIVRGENSDVLTPEAARDTAAALPNATLVTVPNTGHNVPSDDPRAFRRVVLDWLGVGEA